MWKIPSKCSAIRLKFYYTNEFSGTRIQNRTEMAFFTVYYINWETLNKWGWLTIWGGFLSHIWFLSWDDWMAGFSFDWVPVCMSFGFPYSTIRILFRFRTIRILTWWLSILKATFFVCEEGKCYMSSFDWAFGCHDSTSVAFHLLKTSHMLYYLSVDI